MAYIERCPLCGKGHESRMVGRDDETGVPVYACPNAKEP